MARKKTASTVGSEVKAPVSKTTTPVRNTAIPKVPAAPARREITHQMISDRAYYISISGYGGSEYDNWCRAEHELRSGSI